MGELSKTLKNYKNTYISRLAKYLDNHEDNTEFLFLQKELDACNETLEILNTYNTNSKPFGFQTLKDHFDISILENSGFDLDKVDNHIASINRILDFIKHKQESTIPGKAQKEDTYKDKAWFNFGVQLAAGNLREHYEVNRKGIFVIKNESSARIIGEELGIQKSHNIISGTFNNYSKESQNSNRNIFNDPSKILKITEHCDKIGISIVSEFSKRIPKE